MRAGYSEEESFPGEFDLWQRNCERSQRGRKGVVSQFDFGQTGARPAD